MKRPKSILTPGLDHPLVRAASLLAGVVTITAYGMVGRRYYDGFLLPHGYGMYHLLPEELAHIALFTTFGVAAVAFWCVALRGLSLLDRMVDLVRLGVARRGWVTLGCFLAVFASATTVAFGVLGRAVISDDEHAYRFIAETLRTGSLTAPSPGSDLEFFREQFIVLTDRVRYGKYPIGHPLLLALGQSLGHEELVVPLLTAALVLPVASIAASVFGRAAAVLSALLLASSPQVVATGATLLSQPSSALTLLVGAACLLRAEASFRSSAWVMLAGAALGYGVLVRPLPGVLFVVAAVYHLLWPGTPTAGAARVQRAIALAGTAGALAGVILIVNYVQSGDFLLSGYQEFHTPGQGAASIVQSMGGDLPSRAMSVAGTLVRFNVWLFGWPLSLLFIGLAGWRGGVRLIWAFLAAALAYRIVAPKVGVGGAGPLYMFEVLPLACVLTAGGLVRLVRGTIRPPAVSPSALAAVLLPAVLVNVTMFLPPRLRDLARMGQAQRAAPARLQEAGVSNALVFHEGIVPPWTGLSWAYYPRYNSPRLDDDVLFVRLQRNAQGLELNREFWRRRYPDRQAWYFGWPQGGRPTLIPLEQLLAVAEKGRT